MDGLRLFLSPHHSQQNWVGVVELLSFAALFCAHVCGIVTCACSLGSLGRASLVSRLDKCRRYWSLGDAQAPPDTSPQLAVSNNAVFGQLCSPNQQLIFSANNHQSVARVDVFPTGVVQWMEGAASYGWVGAVQVSSCGCWIDNAQVRARHEQMSLDGLAWCVADGGSAIPINPPSNWLPLGSSYRPPRLCVV